MPPHRECRRERTCVGKKTRRVRQAPVRAPPRMVGRRNVHGAPGLQIENRLGVTAGCRRLVERPMHNGLRDADIRRRLEGIVVQAFDLVCGQFAVKDQNLVHVPVEGGPPRSFHEIAEDERLRNEIGFRPRRLRVLQRLVHVEFPRPIGRLHKSEMTPRPGLAPSEADIAKTADVHDFRTALHHRHAESRIGLFRCTDHNPPRVRRRLGRTDPQGNRAPVRQPCRPRCSTRDSPTGNPPRQAAASRRRKRSSCHNPTTCPDRPV